MERIKLQEKTKAQKGTIDYYWFENSNIGLTNTLFHRIQIPLEPFDSGLEYEDSPVETDIHIDWLNLNLEDPTNLDGIEITSETHPDVEASIYLGSAHNWCQVKSLVLIKMSEHKYKVRGKLFVEFDNEGVAPNEPFEFECIAEVIPVE
jgi:hypothetical protein